MNRIIILPPNTAAVDNIDLQDLFFDCMQNDLVIEFAPKKTPTPICECYIEIIVFISKSAAAGVISLYAKRIWQAMEQSLKEKYNEWTVNFTNGKESVQVEVNRNSNITGEIKFEEAIKELEHLSDQIEKRNKS